MRNFIIVLVLLFSLTLNAKKISEHAPVHESIALKKFKAIVNNGEKRIKTLLSDEDKIISRLEAINKNIDETLVALDKFSNKSVNEAERKRAIQILNELRTCYKPLKNMEKEARKFQEALKSLYDTINEKSRQLGSYEWDNWYNRTQAKNSELKHEWKRDLNRLVKRDGKYLGKVLPQEIKKAEKMADDIKKKARVLEKRTDEILEKAEQLLHD